MGNYWYIFFRKGIVFKAASAAQQVAEADHTIEVAFELCFVFGAFHVQFGHTALAVWRLSPGPLGSGIITRFGMQEGGSNIHVN